MENEIYNALKTLKSGGTIIYPTDTLWGIGCDATSAKAVQKVYKIKRRNEEKTMIVLLDDVEKIKDYVQAVPPIAYDLIESWEKPLSIIYDGAKNLAPNLIRDGNSVAIRITRDDFSNKLIKAFGKPIVSSSANFSGEPTPLYFNQIRKELLNEIDYIVNLYHQSMNEMKASTIIKIEMDGSFEVLRP